MSLTRGLQEEPMAGKDIFDLSGKVAVVTGGGSGIGRLFCEAMAEYGADVACCDLNKDRARETVDRIGRFQRRFVVIEADVSRPDRVQYMADKTMAELGNIDILFNNAGIYPVESRVHETAIEDWDRTIAVDLKGVFLCMRAVLPIMIKQGKGNIINTASVNGIMTNDREVVPVASYNVAKAGVIALTRQTATEYAGDGIRVNCIAPGIIGDTSLVAERKKTWPQERLDKLLEMRLSRIPLRRIGTPEDLKGIAVFLASEASSFVTGQTFIIDGGQLA
jgi:NAD(P)-dependent dehydrogenase (short-subunit alcohol dehydrogenase family)